MTQTSKQISFYTDLDNVPDSVLERGMLKMDWHTTDLAIHMGEEMIHTLQMGLLNTILFDRGYRIFVTDADGTYEVKLGAKNSLTDREIRMAHNLFKLWTNGEFSINRLQQINR